MQGRLGLLWRYRAVAECSGWTGRLRLEFGKADLNFRRITKTPPTAAVLSGIVLCRLKSGKSRRASAVGVQTIAVVKHDGGEFEYKRTAN